MKRQGGELRNWYFYGKSIVGNIYNDKNWEQGEQITTSYVVKFDREKGIVETRNTIYTLAEEEFSKGGLK